MATEEALKGRAAAIEEVERVLQSSDDLKRIAALKEDYVARQSSCKAQLSASVASQVEATRTGLELLDQAKTSLLSLREKFTLIQQLCDECRSLVDSHERIARLAAIHYNIKKTLADVEAIASLPVAASQAEELLQSGDNNLLAAHEHLALLEGTAIKAQATLESGGAIVNAREAAELSSYFQRVREAAGRLEERLWSIIRNFLTTGKEEPAILVTAVQVIEVQEMVDAELLSSGQQGSGLRKAWKRRCLQQISMSIQDKFASLLQRCSQLLAAGQDTERQVESILEDAQGFIAHLVDVYDYVSPCFPPEYQIFHYIVEEYHKQFCSMIDFIGLCTDNLANVDILRIVKWVTNYQEALLELGLDEEDAAFDDKPDSGLPLLVECYASRTASILQTWTANIVDGDFRLGAEPKISANGRLWTPGAVDFFRILNEQVSLVANINSSIMLSRIGSAAAQTMKDFHSAQRDKMNASLTFEMLCALVNNNVRCHSESLEFAKYLENAAASTGGGAGDDAIDDGDDDGVATERNSRRIGKVFDTTDINAACRGFLSLAHEGVIALVAVVFSDPGFQDLFPKLHCTEEWRSGVVMGSLLATLQDFLQDFERMLEPAWYKRLAEILVEECIAYYTAAMLTQLKAVGEAEVKAIGRDEEHLNGFFARHAPATVVARSCQVIEDLNEFATSDSVESFVLSYTTLLTTAPGITPALLANILAARVASDKEMTRADAREILDACREVYAAQQKKVFSNPELAEKFNTSAAAASATRGGSLLAGRDATFKAAVSALRKHQKSSVFVM